MTVRYDAEDVRAELRAGDVVAHYGWRATRSGRWYRMVECPSCGGRSSDAFVLADANPVKGKGPGFRCHRCDARGDLIALVALVEGLNPRTDFERVLERAARISGTPPRDREPTAEEHRRRALDRRRQRAEQARIEAVERRRALDHGAATCPPIWDQLRKRNRPGEAYLRERGLESLIGRDDLLRFSDTGAVRVPLYDAEGRMVNIAIRYLPGREPKSKATGAAIRFGVVAGCPGDGCTYGSPDDLMHHDGAVMLVEGMFDYLSGVVMSPGHAVLGARQASGLAPLARVVASRIASPDRELVLIPHHDRAGLSAARGAVRAAVDAGLPRHRIRALDVSAAGDLNDWHRARQEAALEGAVVAAAERL